MSERRGYPLGLALLLLAALAAPGRAALLITEDTKLTANVVCADTAAPCIRIVSPGVTLDLNGFSVIGPRVGRGIGIVIDPGVYNVTIRKGTVTGFEVGIAIGGESAGHRLVGVTVRRNSAVGIWCDGAANVEIAECTARENGQVGILAENSRSPYLHHNTAQENGVAGIVLGTGTRGARVERNVSRFNDGDGIVVAGGAVANSIHRNTAAGNGVVDLRDANGDCTDNLWSRNLFNTRNLDCID